MANKKKVQNYVLTFAVDGEAATRQAVEKLVIPLMSILEAFFGVGFVVGQLEEEAEDGKAVD